MLGNANGNSDTGANFNNVPSSNSKTAPFEGVYVGAIPAGTTKTISMRDWQRSYALPFQGSLRRCEFGISLSFKCSIVPPRGTSVPPSNGGIEASRTCVGLQFQCGSNSGVECLVANEDVVGAKPTYRSNFDLGVRQEVESGGCQCRDVSPGDPLPRKRILDRGLESLHSPARGYRGRASLNAPLPSLP